MSSGEEQKESAAALRNFNCVLNPPPSLHEGGTCLEHFRTHRSEQLRLCVTVTHWHFWARLNNAGTLLSKPIPQIAESGVGI